MGDQCSMKSLFIPKISMIVSLSSNVRPDLHFKQTAGTPNVSHLLCICLEASLAVSPIVQVDSEFFTVEDEHIHGREAGHECMATFGVNSQ